MNRAFNAILIASSVWFLTDLIGIIKSWEYISEAPINALAIEILALTVPVGFIATKFISSKNVKYVLQATSLFWFILLIYTTKNLWQFWSREDVMMQVSITRLIMLSLVAIGLCYSGYLNLKGAHFLGTSFLCSLLTQYIA